LSACGGGGSDSSSAPAEQRFTGSQVINLTGSGANETQAAPFVLSLNGNSISITDTGNPAVTASGTLSGTNFTASGSTSVVDRASGNISGSVPCTNGINSVTFNASGTFTGNR